MAYENTTSTHYDPKIQPHVWTQDDFANLGLDTVAYVRAVPNAGKTAYIIFAADGTKLASSPDRALAFATVMQNDLDPLSVH